MKVPDTKENLDKCLCPECPSYNACMKEVMQGLFCSRGKTNCDFEDSEASPITPTRCQPTTCTTTSPE